MSEKAEKKPLTRGPTKKDILWAVDHVDDREEDYRELTPPSGMARAVAEAMRNERAFKKMEFFRNMLEKVTPKTFVEADDTADREAYKLTGLADRLRETYRKVADVAVAKK